MPLRKSIAFALVAFLVLDNSCTKNSGTPPYPTFILQYESSKENYDQFCTYNGFNFTSNGANISPLIAGASLASTSFSDSIQIFYISYLQGGNRFMSVTMSKKYALSDLDSSGGQWFPKNSADFLNIFKPGKINLNNGTNPSPVVFSLSLQTGNGSGGYLPYVLPASDSDEVEIVNATTNLSWFSLINPNTQTSYSYSYGPQIMVTFNFHVKLFNNNNPNDSLVVTNGIYQGYFTAETP